MIFTRVMLKSLNHLLFDRARLKNYVAANAGLVAIIARRLISAGRKAGFSVPGFIIVALVLMRFPAFATGSVTLAWNASTDATVSGYNIYYGGASRAYTGKLSVGKVTEATISGLVEGTTYYFAATTYSASGVESALSSELAYLVPVSANQPPTFNAINNLAINENAGLQIVSLSDITSGAATENQTLTVTAVSSDTNLIPNPQVNYTSPNPTGSLTFTPVHAANGTAIITVIVNDGQTRNNTVVRTFTVTVIAAASQFSLLNPLTNQVAMAGQTVMFSATTSPGGPAGTLSYQWKFNGSNLPSATGPTLTLSKVTTNQTGVYSVTAASTIHSTSRAATLTVYSTAAAALTPAAHASGQYALAVAGVPGFNYVVQASTNLVNWVPVQTNTAPFTFVDANAGKFRQRFYRSVYAPLLLPVRRAPAPNPARKTNSSVRWPPGKSRRRGRRRQRPGRARSRFSIVPAKPSRSCPPPCGWSG